MSTVFFYGLFMDRARLESQGLQPTVLGAAVLRDYRIQIGARATLLRAASRRAYGIVMELADEDARALYSDESVREYVAERVQVELLETSAVVEADCYNLPESLLGGTNPAYATELARLTASFGFEQAYVDEIAAFSMRP